MKHLKFIFLSYLFLNICSVFASEDQINHYYNQNSASAELVSEIGSELGIPQMNNSFDFKTFLDDESNLTNRIYYFFDNVFYSKRVVKSTEIVQIANLIIKHKKKYKYNHFITNYILGLSLEDNYVPDIVMRLDPNISYCNVRDDIMTLNSTSIVAYDGNGCVADINPSAVQINNMAHLNEKGGRFSRRFKHLMRTYYRLRKYSILLEKKF